MTRTLKRGNERLNQMREKKTKTTNKIEIRLSGNEFAKERTESNAMRKERSKKKQQQRTENSSTRVIYNYEKKSTSKKNSTHTTKLLGNINERAS